MFASDGQLGVHIRSKMHSCVEIDAEIMLILSPLSPGSAKVDRHPGVVSRGFSPTTRLCLTCNAFIIQLIDGTVGRILDY